nr:LuxR C-terminal-related transcriptional regulator [Corynebacterium pygosceleis]
MNGTDPCTTQTVPHPPEATPVTTTNERARSNAITARECDVLRLSLTGDTIAGIAGRLGLSPGTVRNHISHAMAKTHAATRTEAAVTAREHGWI